MTEKDPYIIQTNIAHFRAMLKLDMDHEKRRTIERLLAEAQGDLALERELKKQ